MTGGSVKSRFGNAFLLGLVLLAALSGAGCSSHRDAAYAPKVNKAFLNLTKEEIYANRQALYEAKKYQKAREHFTHVYENFPNDPLARLCLMRIADTFFKQGGPVNLVEAQYKYRDFINRYPGSDVADYAMLQIANVAYEQMERPDRDQTKTKEAVQKYKEMIALYPASPYRPEAEKKLQSAYDHLAAHEHGVASFYIKRGAYGAALPRLELLIKDYPTYARRDVVYYNMGEALAGVGRVSEARLYLERVISEFPDSKTATDARKKLEKLPA
jgi:outer membrane protein assembly factor BamD